MSHVNGSRNRFDNFSIPMVFSALKQCFSLCREVHKLFLEVSQLLAVLYTLSTSFKDYSIPTSSTSESQLASFFRQASLGAHVRPQLKQKADVPISSSSTSFGLNRLAPESVQDLEQFIRCFFQVLQGATIVCLSILKDGYMSWLTKLLSTSQHSDCAWMMLSRLNLKCEPIVIVLPIGTLAGSSEEIESISSSVLFENKTPDKLWHCPWGHNVVDELAPLFKTICAPFFKTICEGDFKTYKGCTTFEENTTNSRLWWERKHTLDHALHDLLSAPSEDELIKALESHSLYIYVGHGPGDRYISDWKIHGLKRCAATLLIGCHTGYASLEGSYADMVAPLHYLYAGSPLVVSSLWNVLDTTSIEFCELLLTRLKEALDTSTCCPRIGSILAEVREAVFLPYLMGAALVCYGIPTGIQRKNA